MRIHTEKITWRDLYTAAAKANVMLLRDSEHGSRKRDHAFDVILSGEAPHRVNSTEFGHEYAASWDQWGIFLAWLFAVDPDATCWAYDGAEDFHRKTGERFGFDRGVQSTNDSRYRRTSHRFAYDGMHLSCVNTRHGECDAVVVR